MLNLPWIHQVKLEVGDVEDLAEVIIAFRRFNIIRDSIGFFRRLGLLLLLELGLNAHLLALFELLAILQELVQLASVVLILVEVVAIE